MASRLTTEDKIEIIESMLEAGNKKKYFTFSRLAKEFPEHTSGTYSKWIKEIYGSTAAEFFIEAGVVMDEDEKEQHLIDIEEILDERYKSRDPEKDYETFKLNNPDIDSYCLHLLSEKYDITFIDGYDAFLIEKGWVKGNKKTKPKAHKEQSNVEEVKVVKSNDSIYDSLDKLKSFTGDYERIEKLRKIKVNVDGVEYTVALEGLYDFEWSDYPDKYCTLEDAKSNYNPDKTPMGGEGWFEAGIDDTADWISKEEYEIRKAFLSNVYLALNDDRILRDIIKVVPKKKDKTLYKKNGMIIASLGVIDVKAKLHAITAWGKKENYLLINYRDDYPYNPDKEDLIKDDYINKNFDKVLNPDLYE